MTFEEFKYLIGGLLFAVLNVIAFGCYDVAVEMIKNHNRLKEILKDETIYR